MLRTDSENRQLTGNGQLTTRPSSPEGDALDSGVIIWAETHHVGIFLQGVVYDAPIVRIHGLEFDRSPGNPHGVSDLTDPLPQLVVPHRAPMADVDLYSGRISILGLEDPVEEELQIFKRLALVANQRLTLGCKNLKLTTGVGLDFLDIRDEAKVTKHGV
jgi:hypothetical protein